MLPEDSMRTTVNSEALAALITYADGKRDQSDSQFLCSRDEEADSQREFDALVAALAVD